MARTPLEGSAAPARSLTSSRRRYALAALGLYLACLVAGAGVRRVGRGEFYPWLRGGLPAAETFNPGRHAFRSWWRWEALSFGDWLPIWTAARELRSDPEARIYRPRELSEGRASFVYAPFSALLMAPFAGPGVEAAAVADRISVANHVLVLAAVVLLLAMVFRGARAGPFALAAAALHVLAFYPLAKSLELTQAGVWITFGLAASLFLLDRGRAFAAGLALALALSIKPHLVLAPLALLAVPGFPRRALLGCAVGLALTTAASIAFAGWSQCVEYVTVALPTLSAGYAWYRNQGFNGLLLRLATEQDPADFNLARPDAAVKLAASVLGLALVVAVALACRRAARRGRGDPTAFQGALVAAAVLASPVCWFHHLAMLLPTLAAGARLLVRHPELRRPGIEFALLGGGILAGSFFEGEGLPNGPAALFSSLAFYGALLALFGLLRALSEARAPGTDRELRAPPQPAR